MIDLGWGMTLGLMAPALVILLWSIWVSRKPPDPMRPRLLNHALVQIFAAFWLLIFAAHVVTLIAGGPITGRRM